MRFKNPSAAGRASQRVQRERRLAGAAPARVGRPEPGLMLYRIRVDSLVGHAYGFEIVVRQATRLNQVTVEVFGQRSKPHGMDWLMRQLRKKLVTRWLPQ